MMMRGSCVNRMAAVAGVTLAAVLLAVTRVLAGTPITGFDDTVFVSGLSEPTAIAFLPDGRMLVVEKGGAVKVAVGGAGNLVGTIPVCTGSEMGLLGIAVDPSFTTNSRLYLYRTESVGGCAEVATRSNEVVRTTLTGAALGAVDVLLTGIRTDGGNHDGGVLRIGPDGKLYAGVGDTGINDGGAPGDSSNPYAQDLGELNGKILRLNLDGSVPLDNPFAGTPGARGEIYAYGFRNPFRMSFDPLSGALWAGDVGQGTIEEIDRVGAGANHSWPYCEGSQPDGCADVQDVVPVYEYNHNGNSASVTGGAFAVGGTYEGNYFFGDFVLGEIWQATLDMPRTGFVSAPTTIVTNAGGPADFVFGPDGALYYVAYSSGEVRRLSSTGFAPPTTTTTTTTTPSSTTTTTTIPSFSCDDTPTFACVRNGLDALDAMVAALGDLGSFDDRLTSRLANARDALDQAEQLAGDGKRRPARAALKRTIRSLAAFRQRLTSPSGKHHVGRSARSTVLPIVDREQSALRALRSGL
jgi:glucose/arabinose dehydrogenase